MTDQSREAQDFLYKHVHANCSQLIDHLLKDPEGLDAQWAHDLFGQYEESEDSDYCPEPDPELREPYEFWIISSQFAYFLQQHNQLLTDYFGFHIWGRETTGQSILLDYVFQQVWKEYKGLTNEN